MNVIICLAAVALGQPTDGTERLREFRGEFVVIQPGLAPFPPELAAPHDTHETPGDHRLPRRFEVAKYEVTQDVWQVVMGQNPSRWRGPRNAVENLTRDEANEFCQRVTRKLHALELLPADQCVRLPTESEWEYFARAGTTTAYSFGDDPSRLDDYAWFHGNAAGNDPPVGAKRPNPWGLYDVHGYLWEWCGDLTDTAALSPSGDQHAEVVRGDDQREGVLRGGSWKDSADKLTSAYRRVVANGFKDDAVGLRCVIAASPSRPRPSRSGGS